MKNLYIVLSTFILINCGIYSFVTSSLPNDVKTFSMKTIYSKNPSPEAIRFAEKLNDKLNKKLKVTLKEKKIKGDIYFEGNLSEYNINRIGAIYEVHAKVDVNYTNYKGKVEPISITKKYKLRDGMKNISQNILNEMTSEIVYEILSKTISKW